MWSMQDQYDERVKGTWVQREISGTVDYLIIAGGGGGGRGCATHHGGGGGGAGGLRDSYGVPAAAGI